MEKVEKAKRSREETDKFLEQFFPDLKDQVNPEEFFMGMKVELEHGTINPETNITNDDPKLTAKIVMVHLLELSDYYTRLEKMEEEGEKESGGELAEQEKIDTADMLYPKE